MAKTNNKSIKKAKAGNKIKTVKKTIKKAKAGNKIKTVKKTIKKAKAGNKIKTVKKTVKKAKAAPQRGGAKGEAVKPKQKVGGGKSPKPLKKPTVNAQPSGGPTGCTAAPRTGGGKMKAAKPKKKDGAGKSPKPLKKPTVNAQPSGGPTGCTAGKGQHPAPRTGGGKMKAAKPKKKAGAGKSPKPLKKPTMNAEPTVGPTGCTAGKGQHPAPHAGVGQTNVVPQKENVGAGKSPKPTKSQQPGKDVKPKKVLQPTKKSTVKAQTGETANRKRKREEQNGEGVKPKRTKQQGTGDFPAAIQPPVSVVAPTFIVQGRQSIPGPSPMIRNHVAPKGWGMMLPQEHFVDKHRAAPTGRVTMPSHFVDIHRASLIQRVTLVDPILDDLKKWGLLTDEPYDTVRSMATSQEKMRELFRHVKSWGNEGKDKLLESLRKHNEPLIRDLEKS